MQNCLHRWIVFVYPTDAETSIILSTPKLQNKEAIQLKPINLTMKDKRVLCRLYLEHTKVCFVFIFLRVQVAQQINIFLI